MGDEKTLDLPVVVYNTMNEVANRLIAHHIVAAKRIKQRVDSTRCNLDEWVALRAALIKELNQAETETLTVVLDDSSVAVFDTTKAEQNPYYEKLVGSR